jgi:hypothetical protein
MMYALKFRFFMNRAALALLILSGAVVLVPALAEASTASVSNNWAGYVATGDSYTGVGGTWNVPTVSATQSDDLSADATWVGIGGVTSKDLIQAGTQAIVKDGVVSYNAWYETLPDSEVLVPLTVRAGDQVTTALNEVRDGHWQIMITNNTTGQQYVVTVAYDSKHSSADWIEEMPMKVSGRKESYIDLDQFGTAAIRSAYAVVDGRQQTIGQTGASQLVMADGYDIIAKASDLDTSGAGFTVARGDGSETIAPTGSRSNRSYHIVRSYSQLPASVLNIIPGVQMAVPAGVQPQYTVTSGNGYRVVQVSWSY